MLKELSVKVKFIIFSILSAICIFIIAETAVSNYKSEKIFKENTEQQISLPEQR